MSDERLRLLGRVALLIATAFCVHVLLGPALFSAWRTGSQPSAGVVAPAACIAILGLLLKSSELRWQQVRWAVSFAPALFVVSQSVLATLRAPATHWPPVLPQSAEAPRVKQKSITVFLLLDELNAESSGPIALALERGGLNVRAKALAPIGDATAKVIPAMFSGLDYEEASHAA